MIQNICVDNSFHTALQESLRAVSMRVAEDVARAEGLPVNALLGVISRSTREVAVRVGNGDSVMLRIAGWGAETHCCSRIYKPADPLLFIPCGQRSVTGERFCRRHMDEASRPQNTMDRPLPNTPEIDAILEKHPVLTQILILHPDDPHRMICYRPSTRELINPNGEVLGFVRSN